MSKGQMRNLETYKIANTQLNEFEYQKNQGQLTEQLEHHSDEASGTRPLTRAERVRQIMAAAHEKVEKKRKKAEAKSRSNQSDKTSMKASARKAGVRKGASRKVQSSGRKTKKK